MHLYETKVGLHRGQDTYKNSGSHVGPSGANFGRAHQIGSPLNRIYFSFLCENLITHDTCIMYSENSGAVVKGTGPG